jgi:6-phosphogluconolactonase
VTEIRVFPEEVSLANAAAQLVLDCSAAAIARDGHFALALAGGSTPRYLYQKLASETYKQRVNWAKTYFFWGDERCVPPDHPESNFRMARQAVLDFVPIPPDQIYRMPGEINPQTGADVYQQTLSRFFETIQRGDYTFDVVLLGLGEDGHTASLFPGIKEATDPKSWVIASYIRAFDSWRLSLTPAIINKASKVIFLVSGSNKANILHEVLCGQNDYPAQLIRPHRGKLLYMVDAAAAARFSEFNETIK